MFAERGDHKIIWRYDYEYEEKNDGRIADRYYDSCTHRMLGGGGLPQTLQLPTPARIAPPLKALQLIARKIPATRPQTLILPNMLSSTT